MEACRTAPRSGAPYARCSPSSRLPIAPVGSSSIRRNSASVCARGTTRLELLTFSAEGWESFAVVVGAASGALTGLLFVAVSVNAPGSRDVQGCAECGPDARPIRRTAARCDSARHTRTKLGGCSEAELIALGVVTGATMALVGRGKAREGRDETARLIR